MDWLDQLYENDCIVGGSFFRHFYFFDHFSRLLLGEEHQLQTIVSIIVFGILLIRSKIQSFLSVDKSNEGCVFLTGPTWSQKSRGVLWKSHTSKPWWWRCTFTVCQIWDVHKDAPRAESYYDQAMEAAPDDWLAPFFISSFRIPDLSTGFHALFYTFSFAYVQFFLLLICFPFHAVLF